MLKSFLSKLLKSKQSPAAHREPMRHFASYTECPELYYRFNGGQQKGPKKLDALVSYEANSDRDVLEFRFVDEDIWRSKCYIMELWETIPASEYSRKRLQNEEINFDPLTTEITARMLLKEAQKNKSITPKQEKRLAEYGIDFSSIKTREQASSIIKKKDKINQERDGAEALITQRELDKPEIDKCLSEIDKLASSISKFAPAWRPCSPKDLDEIITYRELLEEALEYAESHTVESLQGGPFGDPKSGTDYYLDFPSDPTHEELNNFRKQIFLNYLKEESEEFNHVSILKKTMPNLRISKL